MAYIKEMMINFLLNNANPSIKPRVKKEILNTLLESEENQFLSQILNEKIIKLIIQKQFPNGWIGLGFHGGNKNAGQFDNQETGVKYLAEKAIHKDTPVLRNAINAFTTTPFDDLCYHTGGVVCDEFRYAAFGMNIINCVCIARVGFEDQIDIKLQIQLSIDSFKRVLEVDSVLDITRPIQKGKLRVFNDYEKWPCRYHLDILAHTNSWKTEENKKILSNAIVKLMKTDNKNLIGYVPAVWVGHAVGLLGGFPAGGLSVKTSALLPSPITHGNPDFYNFEYIEWFARCGVIPYIPVLDEAVNEIIYSNDNNGICCIPVLDGVFKGWGPYAGLQLETDWKSKTRKDCDVIFRALLIAHYAEQT